MEVKIGVQHAPREIVFESAESADDVAGAVEAALGKGGTLLTLLDEKGRKIIVPADRVAYVEIGEHVARKVGFGTL